MPERTTRRRVVGEPRRVPDQDAARPHPVLALQRAAGNAAVAKLLRSQTYLRATETVTNGQKDLTTITAQPNLAKGELPDDLSWWLEGMGAMSTTRYNPGQRHYLYPVGFVIEIDADAQVLGNYATDGNTSTLKAALTAPDDYWQAFEKMRVALDRDAKLGEPWRKHAGAIATQPITAEADIAAFKEQLKVFITTSQFKDDAIGLLRTVVLEALRAHYANKKRVRTGQVPIEGREPMNISLGSGLTPAGLDEMEKALREAHNQTIKYGQSSEAKYTESKVHVRKSDVKGTFYNALRGERPQDDKPKEGSGQADTVYPTVPADWTTHGNWHANRYQAAEQLRGALGGGTVKKLDAGMLKAPDGPPPDVKATNATDTRQADIQQLVTFFACTAEAAATALDRAGGDVEQATAFL
jgi:hypothetical protein